MTSSLDTVVVGLGGVTNGGKTTMCRALEEVFSSQAKHLRLKIFHLDDYYRSMDDPRHIHLAEYNTHDWDCLNALDVERFVNDIQASCHDYDLILVEGFLIFNIPSDSSAKSLFTLAYFFDLPYDECRKRRLQRAYDPPDAHGYFEGHVWPTYLKMKADALERHHHLPLYLVDTTQESFETTKNRIVNDIEVVLQKIPLH